jgi:hypothetical protein
MSTKRRAAKALSTILAAVLFTAACGSSPSAEEYFSGAQQASITYDEATDEIFDSYRAAVEDALLDFQARTADAETTTVIEETAALLERTVTEVTRAFELAGEELDAFITAMDDLDPPGDLAEQHETAVGALRRSSDAIPDLIQAFTTVQSLDEIAGAINGSGFGDAQPRVEAACRDLQDAADAAGITADLRCGDDDE